MECSSNAGVGFGFTSTAASPSFPSCEENEQTFVNSHFFTFNNFKIFLCTALSNIQINFTVLSLALSADQGRKNPLDPSANISVFSMAHGRKPINTHKNTDALKYQPISAIFLIVQCSKENLLHCFTLATTLIQRQRQTMSFPHPSTNISTRQMTTY